MQTIGNIKNLPDKCPVDQVQGKVVTVYEVKQVAGKSKQSLLIQDAGGAKLMINAWEHSDLAFYQDKEVIISSGPKGGMKVNIWKDKPSVDVGRTCTFQLLAVHNAQTGASTPTGDQKPANQAQSPSNGPSGEVLKSIHPATVGMCINQACANLTQKGLDLDPKEVFKIASELVKVALHMEKGNLAGAKKEVASPAPTPSPAPQPASAPAPDGGPEEDVPY